MSVEPWHEPPTHGIVDRQQIAPVCRCAQCGGEIYPGGDALTDDPSGTHTHGSVTIHRDCLLDWVAELPTDQIADKFGFVPMEGG